MEKNKIILVSVLSVLVVGGIIFAIVRNRKSDANNVSTSSTENPKNDEDNNEEETSYEDVDHIHDEDEDESEADFDFKEVEGKYEGSVRHTSAEFTANQRDDSATVVVRFSESNTSSSYTKWTMTVKVDKEWLKNNSSSNILRLSYSDCICEDVEISKSGKEKANKVSSNEKGYFDIDGDVIKWNNGATEEGDILNGCEFRKI